MTTRINATAIRDGSWWIAEFTLNGREYGTQAKRLDQLESMVKDAAALMSGEPEDSFSVSFVIDMPQYMDAVNAYKEAAMRAREADEAAAQASRAAVRMLRDTQLPMRDIGTLMGISAQRVSQLARA
ncbi:MAG: hypothetical protein PUK59_00010 [Actinomycetaceae bacterium]|nr:hypothetical protein [Actinomycetaceae bacterium]